MTDPLLEAAAHLASTAPESWKRFTAALAMHASKRHDECVNAADNVQIAQGHAREAAHLVRLFTANVDARLRK